MSLAEHEPAIVTQGLTRRFGDLTAVSGLDLSIPKACIYGFLGPNGCGKSTMIRMLCGLLTPSEGKATVLGIDVLKHPEQLRKHIGYMTQRFSLYTDLSIAENLRFMAQIYGLSKHKANQSVDAQLARFGLHGIQQQFAGTLSGGQRQRLALAAATLHAPSLLFLDEPTSAVDPESRREFWDFLFEMVDAGTSILVTTHFMDEAERCHSLAILDDGKLVANGSPNELIDNIDAAVIEITTEQPRRVRDQLIADHAIIDVAQLGAKLHALVKPDIKNPAQHLETVLNRRYEPIQLSPIRASLEDVFVMATKQTVDPLL